MQQLITNIIMSNMATISLLTMLAYEFLCTCRIMRKDELVEKIWIMLLPNMPYDEKIALRLIRSIFLHVSVITYIISGKAYANIWLGKVIIFISLPLTVGAIIADITRK